MSVVERFAPVRRRPERRGALAVLRALETAAVLADAEIAVLVDDAFVWVGLGLARRARALVERWRRDGLHHSGLGRAEAIYTIALAPPAAASRLRALAGDPVAVALAVINHVFRGELRTAIERCEAAGWFVGEPRAIAGVAYGAWALAMQGELDLAFAVLATWRHHHPRPAPVLEQALLAAEARLESVRHHHVRERTLLEEALAVCDEHELGLERAYLEASHAIALARSGELRAATRIARGWPAPRAKDEQTLAIYRDVARSEMKLLAGDHEAADAAAQRVLAYADAAGNAIYACLARGYRALGAPRTSLRARVAEYGHAAAQLQIPVHVRRHRLLAELAARGIAPRDKALVVRTRGGRRTEPVLRLCFPSLRELACDLAWDTVQGTLFLGGAGPFGLDDHPVLRRVLEAILARPGFELPLGELFEAVWSVPYRPLIHEGKCHVALHRLRALLGGWQPGCERLIALRDGQVGIAGDRSVVVLELPAVTAPVEAPLAERIAAHLAAAGETTPASLLARLGTSRSTLQLALRELVDEGRVARIGSARATRYRIADQFATTMR